MASDRETTNVRRYRTDDLEPEHDLEEQDDFLPPPHKIVRYNMISQRDATKVWEDTCADWGIGESSEAERRELNRNFVAAIVQSTSKDLENLETSWVIRGRSMKLRTLHENMEKYAQSDNDSRIRVFVRSYNNGFFVVAVYKALADPANVEWRNIMAQRTGTTPELAKFAFDTADFLVNAGVKLNADEMRMIMHFRSARTAAAQNSALSVGEPVARNDKSSKHSDYGAAKAVANISARPTPQSAEMRTSMMGLGLK